MIPSLIAFLVVLASQLDVLVFVYACLLGLCDVGLVSAVGVAVWVRLGFGE